MSHKQHVEVIVDVREPEEVWAAVEDHPEARSFAVEMLESGDLVIGTDLTVDGDGWVEGDIFAAFERKELMDYVDAMMARQDRSLEEQVNNMLDEYDRSYVLVEGTPADVDNMKHTKVKPQSVRGSMAKLTALGCPVVSVCPWTLLDENQPRAHSTLVDMAVRLARKEAEDTTLSHFSTGPIGKEEPLAKRIYGNFDGIGRKSAEKMVDEFPVPAVFMALIADDPDEARQRLTAIEGIGEKTASSIIEEARTAADDGADGQ